jgi:hypothetical protein
LVASLAATDAHVPVPLAGVHLTVIAGAGRSVTVAVPVAAPADAVTFVSTEVVSVLVACPPASVMAVPGFMLPWSELNVTGIPASDPPLGSSTIAVTLTLPPFGPTLVGLAVTVSVFAAATPTVIVTMFPAVTVVVDPVPVPPVVPEPPVAPPDTA